MGKINSIELINHTRFDVIIKYMYAKAITEGYDTEYFREIYKEHIRLWNGFKEYNNPEKNSFEAFDSVFKELIQIIGKVGFVKSISQIPVHNSIYPLNGAHRLASALATNRYVYTVDGVNGVDGQLDCGYKFFRNLGLSNTISDRTAIEYAKLKNNTHMVFIFPAAKDELDKVVKVISKYGRIFYDKKVTLNQIGSFNLMRELYLDEPWAGNFQSNFSGFRHKQSLCYPNYNPTTGFLVEFDTLENAVKAKDEIRAIYNIGKHSVHINDTHEETVRLAKLMFNDNSVHHLNNANTVNYESFDKCIIDFKRIINELDLDIDDYCIGGSSPLSAYGLREGNDLDYLHFKDDGNIIELHDYRNLIHSHNKYGVSRYHLDRDEIIYNPDNHFYYRGVKFASLEVVKQLKENRGELKDKVDIDLINNLLN
jgi:hypothetical protein